MELKRYWAIIRRRIGLILLLTLVITTVTGIYSYTTKVDRYAAAAKLIVNQNQDLSVVNGKLDLGTISSNIELIKTYKEIIRSPRIMNIVAQQHQDFGLSSSELSAMVGVTSAEDSQIMSVYAIDTSYARAANVVNAVAETFSKEIPTLMKVDNVSILDSANPNAAAAPMASKVQMNVIAAFALSILLGIGISFLLDYLDDTVKSEEDVRELLGLPVYACLPQVKGELGGGLKHQAEGVKTNNRRSEANVTFEA